MSDSEILKTSTKFVHRCVRFKFSTGFIFSNFLKSDQTDQNDQSDQSDQNDHRNHSL